ncbi:MAG: LysM peptidoglycan-binding domain-containing protein, partial [Magnetovibrio sp.]|nr:LysM peptidoglycan-binding domain-containing protein [Magnetovibrio sp.]
PPPPVQKAQSAPVAKAPAQVIIAPSFDVVRVNPEGNAVMAGRAHPGSTVEILDGENIFGSVATDTRGEWVYVPENLLEPGERRLGLRMLRDGHAPVLSDHVVILVVPPRGGSSDGALALKVRRDGTGPSEVLQKPGPQDIFGVDSVDYGGGNLTISGHAKPEHTVQLYIDNRFIGRSNADQAGRWSISPQADIAPGTYTLRADMLDDKAQVIARRELPFQRAELADTQNLEPGSFIVVQPGNSLWRLAERTYGQGMRYHMIFEANQDLIRNADLIYPGQVFRLPGQ